MKRKVIYSALIIYLALASLAFIIDNKTLEALRNTFTIISGTASFITVVIAILLYNKYGIDKTIKDKNLEVSLKLLEEIKKTVITFSNKNFSAFYRPATWSYEIFESHYSTKLLFPDTYYSDLEFIVKYSSNLFLPKEIKQKLDKIIPSSMGSHSETTDLTEYANVSIRGSKSNKWEMNILNNEKDITMYDYFIKWDDLITTIQDWCDNNSSSKVELNIN